jgi:2,5-dihydroxypyridine 5,6-dioxygenase
MSGLESLFRQELELCGVTAGQSVVVLSQGSSHRAHADAALLAASALGAEGVHLQVAPAPGTGNAERFQSVHVPVLSGNRMAVEMLKQADLVVDLVFLLYAPELQEILAAGARVITAVDRPENLARLISDAALRERVEFASRVLGDAKELRFTNKAGTDVTYALGAYPVLAQYGYTDTPGRWDAWPSGFVATSGADDGVNGRVVAAPGDLILLPYQAFTREPINFTIEAGKITAIDGGVEASILAEYIAGFDDPDAYAISHIGWGMHERAKWSALATTPPGSIGMDGRSYLGNVMFSTGPNVELGGTNATPCHIDLPMRFCDLFLDGEPIIVNGDVVVAEMRPQ